MKATNTPQSACEGKHRFLTMADARRTGKSMRRRGDKGRPAPYRCEVCRGYHIGTGFKTTPRPRPRYRLEEEDAYI